MNKDIKFPQIIDISRFPLICIVLICHSLGGSFQSVEFGNPSEINTYHFISEMISHNYADIAVCLFFFFSGFLIFRGLESFSAKWLLAKWKNRIRTLIIPYVLWNLILVTVIAIKNGIFSLFGLYSTEEMEIFSNGTICRWFVNPVNYPLWYIRDLIVLVLLTPAFYYSIVR